MTRTIFALSFFLLSACQPSLNKQPYFRANAFSQFFKDGAAARPLPEGVVPHNSVEKAISLTPDLLARGRARYGISCAVCHGLTGNAEGLLRERGFDGIPSLLSAKVQALDPKALVNIIRYGDRRMPEMESRLLLTDIIAIAYYVKALQLSQGASLKDLPLEDQAKIKEAK